ncbi:hypothetical protein QA635_08815 [Bradyrhizobium brasilense]|uniref:hypothetical protein n=1 Tax=Bradyrhizobium brasilense TaxID=1419277 RepID=UPI0024B0E862|nr:hypothetical protein [Bradyrhizobium australafricanum]WFU34490.1 hypothetical protein QA635_08815 [Bradyrhizobium australafricanum]
MNDLLGAGDSRQKRPPDFCACSHCGGSTSTMPILNTRQGKSYRLRRCASCEKLSWAEDD